MPRSADPTREIARLALASPSGAYPNDTLMVVIEYAFDQLCWAKTPAELQVLIAILQAKAGLDES